MQRVAILVDDNPADIRVLSSIVQSNGVYSIVVKTGEELLKSMQLYPKIDYIFLDINLPDMNGLQVLKEIAKLNKKYLKRTIMVSGLGGLDVVTEAIRLGAIDYIVKPVDVDVLNEKIKKLSSDNYDVRWYEKRVDEKLATSKLITEDFKILSVGEVSLTLKISKKFEVGENIQIYSDFFKQIGCSSIINLCILSLDAEVEGKYVFRTSYIGLTGNDFKCIRKFLVAGLES